MRRLLTIICLGVMATGFVAGPTPLELVIHIEEGSRLFLEGTSNINSFECLCKDQFGARTAKASVDEGGRRVTFTNTSLALKTQTLDCDNSKINRDLCAALRADEYPNITITLHEAIVEGGLNEDGWADITATATLTITDQSRKLPLSVKGKRLSGNRFRFVSVKELMMTDFGIEPPTALFGLIKVRDKIKINFDLIVRTG
jgi:hypothetical protein